MKWGVFVAGIAVVVLVGSVGFAAAAGFSVTATETTDITPQTITVEGEDYRVSSVGVYDRGESITVNARGSHRPYAVTLYDFDQRIIQEVPTRGSGQVTLESDCSHCEPGTYAVAAFDDRIEAIQLIVLSGYDVGLSVPESAPADATVTARIEVTQTSLEEPPDAVEVVIDSTDDEIRAPAHREGDVYVADVPLKPLSTGEYQVYGVALGEEDIDEDRPEILGMSESRTIEVTPAYPTAEDADPDVVTVVEVADHAPAAEGLQVSVANTTARSIIFANESATGPVTVSEFSDPPGGLTRPAGELLAVVEVTVPEAVRNESATIELAVNATTVTAPERLAVRHYDPEAGRWHPLETTLIDSDGATVDIEAETPGFSLFAVVEASESTPTATPTPMATDTPEAAAITPTTPTESPDEQSGFGIVVAVFGLFATALVVSRRLHR